MKKKSKSLLDRILFLLNSIIAIVLLLSYILPYISPEKAPSLTILSLFVPLLFFLNLLFAIYWIIRLKKQLILSVIVIVLGFGYISSFYKFSEKGVLLNDDIKVMSYNVKMFNHYGWSTNDSVAQKTSNFIKEKDPDILLLQEFFHHENLSISYPYSFVKMKSKTNKFGLVIYSKYQIINSGSLDFKNSANNIIFTDVLKGNDTIRVYNVHLESLRLNPEKENFGEKNSDKLMRRMKVAFKKQAIQTEQFIDHQKLWNGKVIVAGDFNNTAFSWVYKQIAKGKQDAFTIAGKGLGRTFDYGYPVRIDFILPDTNFNINTFKTFSVKYSDHFPILARINLKK